MPDGGAGARSYRITLSGSGATFDCRSDETLLRAGLAAGLAMPYECASGACGSCKARLVDGEVNMRWPDAPGLSARDRAKGNRILCCQSLPTEDCTINVRAEAGSPEPAPRPISAEVAEIADLCDGVRRIVLTTATPIDFLAGQFVLLRLPGDGGYRAYSMANAPAGTTDLILLIKAKPGGQATAHLFDRMAVGDGVDLEGPYGRGYLREDSDRPLIAVAGGSGLAPMLSIVRRAVGLWPDRPVHLYFGADTRAALFCLDEIAALAALFPRFRPTLALRDGRPDAGSLPVETGLVGDVMLRGEPDPQGADLYLAGPGGMVDAVLAQTVRANAIPADRVFFDRFV